MHPTATGGVAWSLCVCLHVWSKNVEWPAKRSYVGLVAVGVQEQAEDILVPPLLRNCLTLNDISFPSHYLPSRTMVLAIVFHCLDHSKMSMMMMMMMMMFGDHLLGLV